MRKVKGGMIMINNKKGLSAIVATLMIILLVLIAVGIIWVVVRNVVESGTQNIDIGAKCLEVDVRATAVSPTNQVTLERGAGGINIDEANGGVVIVFTDGLNSESFDL